MPIAKSSVTTQEGLPTWQQGGEEPHEQGLNFLQHAGRCGCSRACTPSVPCPPGPPPGGLYAHGPLHGYAEGCKAGQVHQYGAPHDQHEAPRRAVLRTHAQRCVGRCVCQQGRAGEHCCRLLLLACRECKHAWSNCSDDRALIAPLLCLHDGIVNVAITATPCVQAAGQACACGLR